MSDSEVLDEMEGLLSPPFGSATPSIPAVSFYQLELTRRTVARLRESSRRLEILTMVLIGVTIVLLAFAMPPAIEIIARFWSR
jgi:hypothetical protein